jgi:hypothetical protein
LVSALAGKAAAVHTHAQSDIVGLAAALAGKSDVGHTHADLWTYARLASDFTTGSATAVDIGLGFTPAANKTYCIEAQVMTRTSLLAVGARVGIAWPTASVNDGVATIRQGGTVTVGAAGTSLLSAAVTLLALGASYPATIDATLVTGASPSGAFRLQLASGVALTNVIARAGSWLRYREIP